MQPNQSELHYPAAETSIKRRKVAASAAVLSLLTGNAAAISPKSLARSNTGYDLQSIYPNFDAIQENLHLEGTNSYLPNGGGRAVLWFEPDGKNFKQHATDPADPNGGCQWDKLGWQDGSAGTLEYTETYDGCGQTVKDFTYQPGIEFAPKYWRDGQKWSAQGVSKTIYYEAGLAACYGVNKWRSYVAGLITSPSGTTVLHTHTAELQNWLPVPGAAPSDLCPAGQTGKFKWLENFYFSKSIAVKDSSGAVVGHKPGLARSLGGNAAKSPNGTNWDVLINNWETMKALATTNTADATPQH